MKIRTILIWSALLAGLLLLAGGCAPPFSKELLASVDDTVLYADLQKDPERYRGKVLMVGGTIVETKNLQEGTQFELVQKPLESSGRPRATDESGGRFLVLSPKFHDAAVYMRGRPITFIAEVAGQRVQPLGEVSYRYPLLKARETHLWTPYSGPRFSIGIGVYRGF
jgi:outer membrane lipoprotein